MEKFDILFQGLKPITLNHALGRAKTGRSYKTEKANEFLDRIFLECLKRKKEIQLFEEYFDIYKNYLAVEICFFIPERKLFVKKGYINHKSLDVDNAVKYTVDSIFKSFNKLDDSAICELEAQKLISPDKDYHILFKLYRRPLGLLKNKSFILIESLKNNIPNVINPKF